MVLVLRKGKGYIFSCCCFCSFFCFIIFGFFVGSMIFDLKFIFVVVVSNEVSFYLFSVVVFVGFVMFFFVIVIVEVVLFVLRFLVRVFKFFIKRFFFK